jgi:hypothetical protein
MARKNKKVIWKLDVDDPKFVDTVIDRMGVEAGRCFLQLLLSMEVLRAV